MSARQKNFVRTMLALAVFVGSVMVACDDIRAIGLDNPVRPDDAFAAIAAETVKGGYHQYPPFYNNVIAPHAVVAKGRVYCAFQNTKGQPIIMVYNVGRKSWSEPVWASQFGLGRDAHGNPSICIDMRGYIHIFYGCHGQAMRHTRSTEPYDITSWQEQPAPTPRATYPQSMRMANNDIYLFYRAGGHMEPWCLRISKDDGQSWSEPERIIEMRLDPPDPL
ncbi:MAG: BNR-4 repeat-containing protein, partial [Phycisphaerae bacterium]